MRVRTGTGRVDFELDVRVQLGELLQADARLGVAVWAGPSGKLTQGRGKRGVDRRGERSQRGGDGGGVRRVGQNKVQAHRRGSLRFQTG